MKLGLNCLADIAISITTPKRKFKYRIYEICVYKYRHQLIRSIQQVTPRKCNIYIDLQELCVNVCLSEPN